VKLAANNVAQKVIYITDEGRAALEENVSKLFTEFDHHRWELDLAITNLNILTPADADKCITAYISKLEELLKDMANWKNIL